MPRTTSAVLYQLKSNLELLDVLNSDLDTLENCKIPSFSEHLNTILGGGFQPGNLYVLCAPPSSGKTTFCSQLCDYLAELDLATLYVTYEMSRKQLYIKSLARISQVNSITIESKEQDTKTVKSLDKAKSIYTDFCKHIYILEADYQLSPSTLKTIARQTDLKLIVIDFLQYMSSGDTNLDCGDNETLRVSRLAINLKKLAQELKIPVLAISDITKDSYSKAQKGQEPNMNALRDSFKIAHVADFVAYLQTDTVDGLDQLDYYAKKKPFSCSSSTRIIRCKSYPLSEKTSDVYARLTVLKNRGGVQEDCLFVYSKAIHTFKEIQVFYYRY